MNSYKYTLIAIFVLTGYSNLRSTKKYYEFNHVVPVGYSGPLYIIVDPKKGANTKIQENFATLEYSEEGFAYITKWHADYTSVSESTLVAMMGKQFAKYSTGVPISLDVMQNGVAIRAICGYGPNTNSMMPLGGSLFHVGNRKEYERYRQKIINN